MRGHTATAAPVPAASGGDHASVHQWVDEPAGPGHPGEHYSAMKKNERHAAHGTPWLVLKPLRSVKTFGHQRPQTDSTDVTCAEQPPHKRRRKVGSRLSGPGVSGGVRGLREAQASVENHHISNATELFTPSGCFVFRGFHPRSKDKERRGRNQNAAPRTPGAGPATWPPALCPA